MELADLLERALVVLPALGYKITVEWTYAVVTRYQMLFWNVLGFSVRSFLRLLGGSTRICFVTAVLHGLAGAPT